MPDGSHCLIQSEYEKVRSGAMDLNIDSRAAKLAHHLGPVECIPVLPLATST